MIGAMYSGRFLPEQEFKEAIENALQDQGKFLKYQSQINSILNAIKVSPLEAYRQWEVLQTELFNNPSVSLLTITDFFNKNNSQRFEYVSKEIDAIYDSSKIGLAKIDSELKQVYYSEVLTNHLTNLFKTLRTESPTKTEIEKIIGRRPERAKIIFRYKSKKQQVTYKEAVFATKNYGYTRGYSGQVADAFLQHLAKYHFGIYQSKNLQEDFSNQNIKTKEGIPGFVDLLMDAKNNTAWFTGGDLIVVDAKKNVIANVQLKTSAKEGRWTGNVVTKDLNTKLQKLLNLFQKGSSNSKNISNYLFEMLKTSAIETTIEQNVQQTGKDFIIEMLKGSNISLS